MSNIAAADSFFGIFGYRRMTDEQVAASESLKSAGKNLPTWEELDAEVDRMKKMNLPFDEGQRKL